MYRYTYTSSPRLQLLTHCISVPTQWVEGATPLYALYQTRMAHAANNAQAHRQAQQQPQHPTQTQAQPQGTQPRAPQPSTSSRHAPPSTRGPPAPPPAPPRPPPAALALRPAEAFYSKLAPALEAAGIPPGAPRRSWPPAVLRAVLLELIHETPSDLISAELWAAAADAKAWWLATRCFARSAAAASVLGYVSLT